MIKQFFQDENSQLSMTRLCTFLLIVGGIAMAFVYPDYEGGYLGMITLGLGGKVTQKIFGENKSGKSKIPVTSGN